MWQRIVSILYFVFMFPNVVVYLACFSWCQSATKKRHNDLAAKVDLDFPLDPNTCWLYMSVLPLIAALLFSLRGLRNTLKVVGSFWWMCLIMFRYFLKMPSTYPRRAVKAKDPVTQFFWDWLHCVDEANCTMPSGHVALCTYLGLVMYEREKNEDGERYLRWAVLIGASTLTTKQHYVMDVLGGFVLASLAHQRLGGKRNRTRAEVEAVLDDIVRDYDAILEGRVQAPKEDLHPGLREQLQGSLALTEKDVEFLYTVIGFKYAFFEKMRTSREMTPRRSSYINLRYTVSLLLWLARGGNPVTANSVEFDILTPALHQGLSLINQCFGLASRQDVPGERTMRQAAVRRNGAGSM